MEESRKQFEEWASNAGHNISRDTKGLYVFSYAATAWIAWQASRAAIEIELPDAGNCDNPQQAIAACIEELRGAGLKIKGE